jgi:hypothetical protein
MWFHMEMEIPLLGFGWTQAGTASISVEPSYTLVPEGPIDLFIRPADGVDGT